MGIALSLYCFVASLLHCFIASLLHCFIGVIALLLLSGCFLDIWLIVQRGVCKEILKRGIIKLLVDVNKCTARMTKCPMKAVGSNGSTFLSRCVPSSPLH